MAQAATDRAWLHIPRPVHVPKSRRRPFRLDPDHLVYKRVKFGRKIRAVLYGFPPETRLPCWGDRVNTTYCRETTWGFLVREFEKLFLRYIEIMEQARIFVQVNGYPEFPTFPEARPCLDVDLALMQRFEKHLKDHASKVKPWKRRRLASKADIVRWWAKKRTEHFLLSKICPLCGEDLPCPECGVPLYRLVPGWGLRAV